MSTHAEPNTERALVERALDNLLADHPPQLSNTIEFRGHQFDAGLAWVQFPIGHGGLAVSADLQATVDARLRSAGIGAADPAAFFLALAGPTIAEHGTDEHRRRFLRPMFTGEQRWCQLFSEPGAGSDFAGLAASAVRDGDVWRVTGQKVWNTMAHIADWGMLVTRSDPDAPKHRGMTYFVVDMHAPGVEIRPIRQITGESEFNEVFLDDVIIPDSQRIGREGDGWRVALTTLMNERSTIGGGAEAPRRGSGPIAELVDAWLAADPSLRTPTRRDRLIRLWSRAECQRLTNLRASTRSATTGPGPEGSIAKLAMAELNKAIFEAGIELLGADALIGYDYTFIRRDSMSTDGVEHGVRHAFMRVRANSIEGGTSEIMRNILGEQILGLPGEPRVDKDIPWIRVPRSAS